MAKKYNENSIESLSPLEFTRLRAGVYCGSTEYSSQLLIEVFSNSVDEFNAGHGDTISVKIKDNKITVSDNGQGFLTNTFREDGKTILEASFSVLNTSGKFREDGTYEGVSTGLNGIGCKLATYLSNKLKVTTYRDNKYETCWFKEGVFDKREVGDIVHASGTIVEWQPSAEFFTNVGVEINRIKELFETTACLCPGLTIKLDNNGEKITYKSKKGLNDLTDKEVGDKEILKKRLIINAKQDRYKLDAVLTFTSDYSSKIIPYVNTGLTERGVHLTKIKTIITRELNSFYRDKGWLKAKDENLSGDEAQEGLFLIFNMVAPGVAYDAQTKGNVVKLDAQPVLDMFTEQFKSWLNTNSKEVKKLADKAINARKAKEAAKKARDAARSATNNVIKKDLRSTIALSDKFIDCVNKNPKERNLLLVEGLSAGTSAGEARDVKRDAIYMLRGKTVSPLKTSLDKILANQEMSNIVSIIGAGIGDTFDEKKMQFDKIVITSDADSDGHAIELLLTTFFYTYMRPLVENGHLYRAVTPLYIVETKKGKEYLYNEEELENWKNNNVGVSYELTHAKGLGELSPAQLKEVCFEKQRFKQIVIKDAEETTKLLNILEGKDVAPRKQYIYDNAEKLGFNFI